MKFSQLKWLLLSACFFSSMQAVFPANAAEEKSKVEVRGQLALQYITDESRDLGALNQDRTESFSEQAQMDVNAKLTPDIIGYFEGRALNIDGESGFDDDTGENLSAGQSFVEMRQLWLRWDNLFDVVPLGVQIGRQRVREPYALWWNNDLDMVRFHYDSTLLTGFIGVGENLASYRTGSDNELAQEDEDRLRVLGEASWQYNLNHFIEGRFLHEDDHSGLERTGSIIRADDRDNEDLNATWAGFRATGSVDKPFPSISKFGYKADLIGLAGEVDMPTSVAGPGANQRTITGSNNNDVRAWAFDGNVTLAPVDRWAITVGYAYGSGDDDPTDGTDHAFRQTDMHSNSSRPGVASRLQRNYGEALRPELSNIHIMSIGTNYQVTDSTDAGITYFNYHLAEDATSLRSANISAPMNGTDKDIGQEADVFVNVDVARALDVQPSFVEGIKFRVSVGSFFPGDAYKPNGTNEAFRAFSELKFNF